jgi:hypothetical protein
MVLEQKDNRISWKWYFLKNHFGLPSKSKRGVEELPPIRHMLPNSDAGKSRSERPVLLKAPAEPEGELGFEQFRPEIRGMIEERYIAVLLDGVEEV